MLHNSKHPWDEIESQHEGEGDEGWVVSYADMVTLLFGFFVILYSFSTVDEKKYDSVTANLAKTFKSTETEAKSAGNSTSLEEREIRALQMLVTMMKMDGQPEAAMKSIEKAYARGETDESVATAIAAVQQHAASTQATFATEAKETTINLMIPGETVFKTGSSEVNASAAAYLQKIAKDLNSLSGITKVEITGHTDSTQARGTRYFAGNFTLSSLRAGAVAELLIRYGLDERKLAIRGVGNLDPLMPEYDSSGKAIPLNRDKNRRVQITIHRSRE